MLMSKGDAVDIGNVNVNGSNVYSRWKRAGVHWGVLRDSAALTQPRTSPPISDYTFVGRDPSSLRWRGSGGRAR